MEKYLIEIENGFADENELNRFIDEIALDETLNDKKYEFLRRLAIGMFYEK